MGRKKGIPTCVISIREKKSIKKKVQAYAKKTGMSVESAYKKMIREGRI